MNQKERIATRNAIEDQLLLRLDNIINKIKSNGIKDTGLAQRLLGQEVDNSIRAAAEDAYQLGIDYVTSKRKTVGFMTSTDQEIIRNQVLDYSIKFWRKVDFILHRNDVLLQKYNYEPRSELNSNAMATQLAVGIVTTTLALATRQKAIALMSKIRGAAIDKRKKCPKGQHYDYKLKKCVDDDSTTPTALPYPPQPDNLESDPLGDLLNSTTLSLGLASLLFPDDPTRIILVWNATLDNRTCPVCESNDGSRWLPDDPDLPVLGDEGDIHYNCRCMWDVEQESIY